MALTEKEEYRKSISSIVNKNYAKFVQLMAQKEISEDDAKILESITKSILDIESQTKVVAELPTSVITKISRMYKVLNEKQHLFSYNVVESYSPYSKTLNTYSNNEGKNIIVKNFNAGIGTTRTTSGIVDDVTNFSNDPIVSVSKQVSRKNYGGYIHQVGIGEEYQISFEFALNRFPSKTYQSSEQSYSMKQLTSRNTELITFEYDSNDDNKPSLIEFGAMAPLSVYFPSGYMFQVISESDINYKIPEKIDKGGKVMTLRDLVPNLINHPYKNLYSPFSIAASISCGNNYRISVSTDYKFELGKYYTVTLTISKNIPKYMNESNGSSGSSGMVVVGQDLGFGDKGEYIITMEVNNVRELISPFQGKPWGRKGNRAKNNNDIPSQPNFRYRCLPKAKNKEEINKTEQFIRDKYTYQANNYVIYNLEGINLSSLKYINTVPYTKNTHSLNKLYNKHMSKTNRGVIFKSIDIYSM